MLLKFKFKFKFPANQFLDLPTRADNDHHKKQAATFSPVGAKKKKSSENFAQHDFLSRRRQLRGRFRFLVCDVGRRRRMDWVIAVGGVATGQCRIRCHHMTSLLLCLF